MALKVPVPKEFLEELSSLFRALEHQQHAKQLTLQTQDALARVISWVPHFEPIASQKIKDREPA